MAHVGNRFLYFEFDNDNEKYCYFQQLFYTKFLIHTILEIWEIKKS